MIKIADRVFETSITTGTGTLNLGGPIAGFRSFVSAFGDGAKVGYHINNGEDWESGFGTVTAGSPDTLSRDTVLESSNSGAAVNFGGELNVFCAPIAELTMIRDQGLNFSSCMGTGGGTANAHTVTMPVTPIAYTDGMVVMYRAPAANTSTTVNVNVDNLGNKAIKVNGNDLEVGQIANGALVCLVFNQAQNRFDAVNLYQVTGLGTMAYEDADDYQPVNPRTFVTAATGLLTPTNDIDIAIVTSQNGPIIIGDPTGTWVQGQGLVIRLKDNGTARAITWQGKYRALGIMLPATTVPNKTMYVSMIWNATDSKFDVTGVAQEV